MRVRTGTVILTLAIATLALTVFLAQLSADAAGKAPRIGYLSSGSASPARPFLHALRQGLRDLGWVEGRNIVIEYRFGEGRPDRLLDLAAELVRLKVDIIVAGGPPAAFAASKATTTIPIVFFNVGLPVELGLISSLDRPGGNITGASFDVSPETNAKRLELLKEMVPKLSRVAALRHPANPGAALYWKELQRTAQALAVKLQSVEVQGPDDFESALVGMMRKRPDALFVEPSPLTFVYGERIAELSLKNRLPAMCAFREAVEAGCLISYGPNTVEPARRAATFVDRILKGAKPADLPVEQPMRFELVVNLKTAKALGLTIPQSVLIRADEVIQ